MGKSVGEELKENIPPCGHNSSQDNLKHGMISDQWFLRLDISKSGHVIIDHDHQTKRIYNLETAPEL